MELNNEFRVGVPVAEAWRVLTDVERIAPMLPGAQLQEVEDDEYRGVVKVKVGPITAQYKGTATFVERDEVAGRVVLRASGRDTRGQGNASATITATMVSEGDATRVTVATDLTITGKVAQFGRGVLADVSAKLIGQFVDTLEADLTAGGGAEPATAASAAPGDAAGLPGDTSGPAAEAAGSASTNGQAKVDAGPGRPAGPPPDPAPPAAGPRRIDGPEAEPLDLLAVAGGSTAKRLLPVVGVLVVIVAVLLRRRAGRGGRG